MYVDDEVLRFEKAVLIRIQTVTSAHTSGTWYNVFFNFV